MCLALVRLPQAVEFEAHILQAQIAPQCTGQQNQFCVHLGAGKTQCLGADLVKLAVASSLGALMTKHGAHVIQPLATVVQHGVLRDGAHHTGRRFGAKGELLSVEAILKRIHLLLHNIGDLAQSPHEQRRGLDNRSPNIAVGIARHQVAHLGLQPFPAGGFWRQDVVHALHRHQLLRLGREGAFFVAHSASFLCLAQIDKNCSDPVTVPVPEYIPEQAMAAPSFKQQRLQRQNAFRCTARRCDETHWQCRRHAGSLPFPRR